MRVELTGTAGPDGWPAPGCRCASCRRAAAGGGRGPASVLVDGTVRLDRALLAGPAVPADGTAGRPGWAAGGHRGYRITPIPGGWDITGPAGRRLLAGAHGRAPDPPPGAGGYDIALLDLIADPWQLGRLRRRGLVTGRTVVAAVHADHRVSSPAELARRCLLWGALAAADGEVLTAPGSGPAGAGAGIRPACRTLVLGGARSGKSAEAELRLAAEPEVSYVAPGRPGDADRDWAARVAAHRARRPPWWQTVETGDVAAVLGRARGAVLIDGVGGWLAGAMDACGSWSGGPGGRLQRRIDDLVSAWRGCRARIVAVSEETGLGVIPPTSAGRLFRDQLGRLNQRLATESDETVLVVAGRVLSLPG